MSIYTHKPNSISWAVKKAVTHTIERIGKFEGHRVPFSERRVILLTVDIALILIATWFAFIFWGRADTGELLLLADRMISSWYWFIALPTGWWILSWLNDLYDIPSSYHPSLVIVRLFAVVSLALFIYLLAYFAAPVDALPRVFFLNFLFASSLLIVLWRLCYVRLSEALPFYHRILIVGLGNQAETITDALKLSPRLKYQLVGYVDTCDSDTSQQTQLNNLPVLGNLDSIPALVDDYNVHEVIIALEDKLERTSFDRLVDCQAKGVYVSWMPDLYEKLLRRVPVEHIDPAWALQATSDQPIFSRVQLILKRLLDIVLILMAMPTILVAIPFIALAVWLDSGGPVFFKQVRTGRAGQSFTIYKFRTMKVNAEEGGKAQWAQADDNRITKAGRFLRRTRLDELPQVWNILRGDMSIVGPRPERPEFVKDLQEEIPYYRARLMVKPGLTGWAQVHYPYGNTIDDAKVKLQYDFYYIRHWSIWLDLYTMFQTLSVVLRFRGL